MIMSFMTQAQQSNRVCNALALLQCVASHPETRTAFLNGWLTELFLCPLSRTANFTYHYPLLLLSSLPPSLHPPSLSLPLPLPPCLHPPSFLPSLVLSPSLLPFLPAHIPLFLYPFLHTVSKSRPFEYLRLTSLGVVGALVKVHNVQMMHERITYTVLDIHHRTYMPCVSNNICVGF